MEPAHFIMQGGMFRGLKERFKLSTTPEDTPDRAPASNLIAQAVG